MARLGEMRRSHVDPRLHAARHAPLRAMRSRRRSTQLSRGQHTLLACMGLFQFALLVAAQLDLFRRPATDVRGPKWAWRIVAFINFIGPLSYFAFGRAPEVESADF